MVQTQRQISSNVLLAHYVAVVSQTHNQIHLSSADLVAEADVQKALFPALLVYAVGYRAIQHVPFSKIIQTPLQ